MPMQSIINPSVQLLVKRIIYVFYGNRELCSRFPSSRKLLVHATLLELIVSAVLEQPVQLQLVPTPYDYKSVRLRLRLHHGRKDGFNFGFDFPASRCLKLLLSPHLVKQLRIAHDVYRWYTSRLYIFFSLSSYLLHFNVLNCSLLSCFIIYFNLIVVS